MVQGMPGEARLLRGRRSQRRGLDAEALVVAALREAGWTILGQRLRTAAGEVDIAAEREGLLAIIEVKARPAFGAAAESLGTAQRRRLMTAAEILLGRNPEWGRAGVRFDLWLVASGSLRHVPDAFRLGD